VIAELPVAGEWQLQAQWAGGYWLCAHRSSEEALRKEVYEEGVELEKATVPRTIFERLVNEGRAGGKRDVGGVDRSDSCAAAQHWVELPDSTSHGGTERTFDLPASATIP
jgi:hypothetical protein